MGQAKQRGTFEERKAISVSDQAAAALILKQQEKLWWDSLSDEEKEKVTKNRVDQALTMQAIKKLRAFRQRR
jgi:hypothetical protein